MPELAEVEGFRRFFSRHAAGKRIRGVDVLDEVSLRNAAPNEADAALFGKRFDEPYRRGKWLVAPAGPRGVVLHFGMTGRLQWVEDDRPRHRHDRIVFRLEDGELRYRNMRKLGGVWLATDEGALHEVIGHLGPNADDVDLEGLTALLARRRGGAKAALMDQRLIAGLGNELRSQRQQPDPRCPRCHTPLRIATVAGRTTYWCPRHQPEPGGRSSPAVSPGVPRRGTPRA